MLTHVLRTINGIHCDLLRRPKRRLYSREVPNGAPVKCPMVDSDIGESAARW